MTLPSLLQHQFRAGTNFTFSFLNIYHPEYIKDGWIDQDNDFKVDATRSDHFCNFFSVYVLVVKSSVCPNSPIPPSILKPQYYRTGSWATRVLIFGSIVILASVLSKSTPSRFASVVLDCVLRPPRLLQLSVVQEATYEER